MQCFLKLIMILILLVPSPLFAAEKVVTLATLTDFIPFCFKKENAIEIAGEMIPPGSDSQQLQGYSWDVVRESFHAMGYAVKLYVVPWERAVHYVKTGKVEAIFPANRTPKRQESFLFSRGIVDEMRMVIYIPLSSPLNWNGLESLTGLRVAAVRGWSYGEKWENNQHIIKEKTDTILQSFEVLDKKRLTGVVGYEAAYDFALKQQNISQKYRKVGPFETVREYLLAQKGSAGGVSVIEVFDQGRERIAKNGVLNEITIKWL
ncbi:MAG: transporter substrate-binding domain-containing protein [Desulfoprunum sp.]|nr:transporter substrate-binding domain-containing protein [Desulfoprunum sp.]